MNTPRVKFCWHCGGKLALPFYIEKPIPKWTGDDIPRILHKSCWKEYEKNIDIATSDYFYSHDYNSIDRSIDS